MKKLIFVATMFLISVSANSQIQDVDDKSGWLNITPTKGNKSSIPLNSSRLIGWTSTYILVLSSNSNGNGQYLFIYDSKGEYTSMQFNMKRNASEPDAIITAITPNYFIIKNSDGERKYDKKGNSIW